MPQGETRILNKNLLFHITGIIVFLSLPFMMAPEGVHGFSDIFSDRGLQKELFTFVLMLGFFYLNYFSLIPEFYFSKKYFLYIIIIASFFILVAFLPGMLFPISGKGPPGLRESIPPPEFRPPPGSLLDFKVLHVLFIFLAVVFLSIILKIRDRLKKTEEEKLSSELMFLRAQINPHFLFNTLNGIYSLAIEKSENTADAIVKLSGIMRYVISETEHDYVSLEKEIDYITDYVELQKIRLDRSTKVSFEVKGTFTGKRIAPLILIPFIENAFKFGVNPEDESIIHIHIEVIENELLLIVRNDKVGLLLSNNKVGVGIGNTKTRLNLLYQGKHVLHFVETDKEFGVNLKLNLT